MYATKSYKHAHSVLNSKVLSTYLARGMIFENVAFFKRQEKHGDAEKILLEIRRDRYIFMYTDRFEVIHIKYCVRKYLVFVFPKGQ